MSRHYKKSLRGRLKQSRGITLVELVVAIVLIGSFVGTIIVYGQIMTNRYLNEQRVQNAHIARSIAEHESVKDFDLITKIVTTPFRGTEHWYGIGSDDMSINWGNCGQLHNDISYNMDVTCASPDYFVSDLNSGGWVWNSANCAAGNSYKKLEVNIFRPSGSAAPCLSVEAVVIDPAD